MSNFDIVSAYGPREAEDFRRRGVPHPPVRPDNQMPTTGDLLWALDTLENARYDRLPDDDGELRVKDEEEGYWISVSDFDWNARNSIPGEYFTIRGRGPLALALLIRLCQRCGQLVLWPDTGEPPIILDAFMDAKQLDELHQEASGQEDEWRYFFEQAYGPE